MRQLCRFAFLAGIFTFAAWGATPGSASSFVSCELLDGKPCATPGAQVLCGWAEPPGAVGVCYCTQGQWFCV
jgi:hypothetical protein